MTARRLERAGGETAARSRIHHPRARPATVVPVATAMAFAAIVSGTVLVVMALTGDELRHPVLAASLRAAWIGLYAIVGLYFVRSRPEWRFGLLMVALADVTVVASLDVIPGSVPYSLSRIVFLVLLPVASITVLAFADGPLSRGRVPLLIAASIPVSLAAGAAYLAVAPVTPWSQAVSQCRGPCAGSAFQLTDAPGLARALMVVIALLGLGSIVGALAVLVPAIRRSGPAGARILTQLTVLQAAWGLPIGAGLVLLAFDPVPGGLEPFQFPTALVRAATPLVLLAALIVGDARTGATRDALSARLAGVTDPTRIERILSDALDDPTLRLAFRDRDRWTGATGAALTADVLATDRGWAVLDLSDPGDAAISFDPLLVTQRERVGAVAALGTFALRLSQADDELNAARRRMISAADDERHRIERSLHDGAQQHLIGLVVRAGMAREAIESEPAVARTMLGDLAREAQRALGDLRELAHGLYPSVLVDAGLTEALRSAARHAPLPVDTEISTVGRSDPLHEAAVYFCCSEALQNAIKHGGSDPGLRLRLWRDADRALCFEVADEGPGFIVTNPLPGSGLIGMRDRIGAVGGRLALVSAPGRGTRVLGRVPEGPSPAARNGRAPRAT